MLSFISTPLHTWRASEPHLSTLDYVHLFASVTLCELCYIVCTCLCSGNWLRLFYVALVYQGHRLILLVFYG